MRFCATTMLASVLILGGHLSANADELVIYPSRIQLDNGRDFQRFVVLHTREDGVTVDVTEEATVAVPDSLVTHAADRVDPKANGEGALTATYNELKASVPVTVAGVDNRPAISFENDVEPVLMRAGCNTGKCHGSAQGKNGFRLSLFGFDPKMDHTNLTRETLGRRLDVADPEESLMLQKPAGLVPHEGGQLIAKDDYYYNVLKEWIAEGAQPDSGEPVALDRIEVLPPSVVLEGEGAEQQFIVQAHYADGTDRDVTHLAILSSEDALTVDVGKNGGAVSGTRGEAYIMARFGPFAEIAQVITIAEGATLQAPELPPKNFVDEFVYAKLKKLRLQPAEQCSDEVFVRRVFLDILGVLPTVEETRSFLADEDPEKRAKLIDRLLQRPEFTELWAMKWAEILMVKSSNTTLDKKAMHRYNDWLRHAIQENMPINELVTQLLTAEGGTFTAPEANFYVVESQPTKVAENVAQLFMGVQLQCAQCHDHPFERWTMDDYYSFAAFFSQVGRKNSSDPRESVVFNRNGGEVKNLKDNRVMAPKFLGGPQADVNGKDRRAVLAEWLTAPDNPWFAENFANRVWAHFFGRGIIDPPDDVRTTNPPSHPALLEELGRRLVDYNYDLRQLVRDICNSNTYQLSTKPRTEAMRDEENFSQALIRRLPAELLLDGISKVTETKVKFRSLPLGARAVQVADGATGNYFLSVFGRPPRDSVCTCERRNEPTLAQTLHLINGDTINAAIRDENGRLAQAIAAEKAPPEIIEDLYIAAFSRAPSQEERETLTNYVDSAEDRRQALEDVYWSVLNSKEFIFNH